MLSTDSVKYDLSSTLKYVYLSAIHHYSFSFHAVPHVQMICIRWWYQWKIAGILDEAGWGKEAYLDKTGRRVDTARKVSRPFMSRWQGVAGRLIWKSIWGRGIRRSWPQSSSYFKYNPSHLHSFHCTHRRQKGVYLVYHRAVDIK